MGIEMTLQAVTPVFIIAGADPRGAPELRVALLRRLCRIP